MQAKPPFAITHKPGHMFLTDLATSTSTASDHFASG